MNVLSKGNCFISYCVVLQKRGVGGRGAKIPIRKSSSSNLFITNHQTETGIYTLQMWGVSLEGTNNNAKHTKKVCYLSWTLHRTVW